MSIRNTLPNDRFAQPEYVKRLTADTTIGPLDSVVQADPTAAAVTITLPPAALSAGAIIEVANVATSGANSVTVKDAGDTGLTNIVLANGKANLLYCTGLNWRVIFASA